MYRPKEWKNPFANYGLDMSPPDKGDYDAFEAGADAMLKALRGTGIEIISNNSLRDLYMITGVSVKGEGKESIKGRIVFIPDEVKE